VARIVGTPTICVMADPDLKIKSDRGVVAYLGNPHLDDR